MINQGYRSIIIIMLMLNVKIIKFKNNSNEVLMMQVSKYTEDSYSMNSTQYMYAVSLKSDRST